MKRKNWIFELLFLPFALYVDGDDGGGGSDGSLLGGDPNKGGAPAKGAWFDALPEELRAHEFVSTHTDLPTFVKSALATKQMVGADTIKKPGKDATPEERAAFYDSIGRPKEAAAYESSVKLDEKIPLPDGALDRMKGVFHEAGLTTQQGKAVMDSYFELLNGDAKSFADQRAASHQNGMQALRAEWADATENNIKTAQLAIREMGNEELISKLASAGLDNDPDVIKFFHSIGAKLLDDDATGTGGGRFATTAVAAQQEIVNLTMDTEFQKVLGNKRDPGHKAALERWTALHYQAYPGQQGEKE